MLVNSILLNRNVILYTSYVVGEIVVVFFIRGMTVSLERLKMPSPVMMFNSGQGWGRDKEWALSIYSSPTC